MEIILSILIILFGVILFFLIKNNKQDPSLIYLQKNQNLNEEINELEVKNAILLEKIDNFLQKESNLNNLIAQQKKELTTFQTDKISNQSIIATLKTKLDEQENHIRDKLDSLNKNKLKLKDTILQQKEELNVLQTNEVSNKSTIATLRTKLDEQKNHMEDKLVSLEKNELRLKEQFTNLANEILDKSSEKLQKDGEKSLGNLLNPMKIQLADFKKKIEDVHDKEVKDRAFLQAELKSLKELNQKMSSDAISLTNALKGQSKQQGIWGEMILEKVLQSSGLREGHEYNTQVGLKDDENKRFYPDVIVNLPDNRHIIIDAKTSLRAYNEYMACEDKTLKNTHANNHLQAIKEHVKNLSNKKYEDLKGIHSLDFIFMFIPIEGALMLALESDVNLYDDTFKKKIILVSPTTLLVALRAVENTWRYEKQAQNIADVSKRAEQLYNKFIGFIESLEKVGSDLKKANQSYENALGQLTTGKGNLIWQAEKLKEVSNIKPKKILPKEMKSEIINQ